MGEQVEQLRSRRARTPAPFTGSGQGAETRSPPESVSAVSGRKLLNLLTTVSEDVSKFPWSSSGLSASGVASRTVHSASMTVRSPLESGGGPGSRQYHEASLPLTFSAPIA